uniref:Uncharacterized protein n=1 Tax=Rhizophora mucronata TaxID=61149 RepID=A0A2P2NW22_RHIMU
MRRRPSDNLPVDLRKKERPLGRLTENPRPATSPPVSELESPKLKMTGGFLQWEATEVLLISNGTVAPRRRRRRMRR